MKTACPFLVLNARHPFTYPLTFKSIKKDPQEIDRYMMNKLQLILPLTVTLNWHIPVLPASSVALQVTKLTPSGNESFDITVTPPDDIVQLVDKLPSTTSMAVAISGIQMTMPSAVPAVTFTASAVGQVTLGFSLSINRSKEEEQLLSWYLSYLLLKCIRHVN